MTIGIFFILYDFLSPLTPKKISRFSVTCSKSLAKMRGIFLCSYNIPASFLVYKFASCSVNFGASYQTFDFSALNGV